MRGKIGLGLSSRHTYLVFFNKFITPSPLGSQQLTKTALCSSLPNSLFLPHSFLFLPSYITTVIAVAAQSQVQSVQLISSVLITIHYSISK